MSTSLQLFGSSPTLMMTPPLRPPFISPYLRSFTFLRVLIGIRKSFNKCTSSCVLPLSFDSVVHFDMVRLTRLSLLRFSSSRATSHWTCPVGTAVRGDYESCKSDFVSTDDSRDLKPCF